MSATSSRLHRGSSAWTTTSTSVERLERPARAPEVARETGRRRRLPRSSGRTRLGVGVAKESARGRQLSSSRPAAISVAMAMAPTSVLRSPLIAGPTASGKSALALALAERREASSSMPTAPRSIAICLVSARPTPEDSPGPGTGSTAPGRRRALLGGRLGGGGARGSPRSTRRKAADPGRRHGPLLRTLLDGIAPVPEIDPAVRAAVRSAGRGECSRPRELIRKPRLASSPATRHGWPGPSKWCVRPAAACRMAAGAEGGIGEASISVR